MITPPTPISRPPAATEAPSYLMLPATPSAINAIPMLQTLGIRLCESGPDFAVMAVTVDERHANYFGGVHGGLIATLADTVCFFPQPLLPAGRAVTTANLNLNYIRAPKLGDRLTARSKIEHLGRRTVSLTINITTGDETCIAHGTATLIVLQQPAGDQPPHMTSDASTSS